MVARPTTLDLLTAEDVWMVKLDTDSSLCHLIAAFLDPGATLAPGRKRKIPLLALARISTFACNFATVDHHVAHGIRAQWRARMRDIYLSVGGRAISLMYMM